MLEIIDPPVGPHGQPSAGTYANVGGIWAMSQGAANAGKGESIFAPLPPPPADVAADLTRTASEGEFNLAAGRMPFSQWNAYVQSPKSAGLDEWVKEATKRAGQLGIIT